MVGFIECAVAEHSVENIEALSGQRNEGSVMAFSLVDLAASQVLDAGSRKAAKADRESLFEHLVAPRGRMFAPD